MRKNQFDTTQHVKKSDLKFRNIERIIEIVKDVRL